MGRVITEYTPQAQVIFVKKFQSASDKLTPQDAITVASNVGDLKEISSITVELTVKNNPGTFSITLVDTNNKFIIPDNPVTEIPAIFNNSKRKVVHSKAVVDNSGTLKTENINPTQETTSGTFYEFQTWEEWKEFKHIFISAVENPGLGKTYPTQYIRDVATGAIIERWAIDTAGNIIYVSTSLEEENSLQESLAKDPYVSKKLNVFKDGNDSNQQQFYIYFLQNKLLLSKFKDIKEQGVEETSFRRGRCKISPMDRVVIFLSPTKDDSSQVLVRAFTGVVSLVQEGYSENNNTITISGEDVTKYLQVSLINVNPALQLSPDNPVDQTPEQNIQIWSNYFSGMSIIDIVKAMLIGNKRIGSAGYTQYIDGVSVFKLTDTPDGYDYVFDAAENVWKYSKEPNKTPYKVASFQDALGNLFGQSSVHIYDMFHKNIKLKGFDSYRLSLGTNFSFFQADFKTRREILYKCAEDTNFNFFADRNGEIWFRPQYFSNAHILQHSDGTYVIHNKDIISFGFVEDDSRIYTSVYVTTEPPLGYSGYSTLGGLSGSHRDENAILKYGVRIFATSNPIIRETGGGLDESEALTQISKNAAAYAKSLLQRLLASRYQGQITIPGRVMLAPGYPVYIPIRNKIYFVETVTHSYSYGGSFQTTIHLNYGRKPWDHIAELLTYSDTDDMYLTDGYLFENIPNTSDIKSDFNIVQEPNFNPDEYYTTESKKGLIAITINGKEILVHESIAGKITLADFNLFSNTGAHLVIISAWRSYKEQAYLYDLYKNHGGPLAAPPGSSNHERGKAIDVVNWEIAQSYLHAVGLYNNLVTDRPHFSESGR